MTTATPGETSLIPAAAPAASPAALFRAMRPRHWVKNSVVLAGILFTLDQHHPAGDWLRAFAAVAVFCALASAIYLVNDVCDLEQDRLHPRKCRRPIAAGQVSVGAALIAALALAAGGLAGSALLGLPFALAAGGYVALTVGYSTWLKHCAVLDVMVLAGCYVLRAAAGALVVAVEISPWLMICTTLGALLIGLAKRRNELLTLENAGSHRRVLDGYTLPMLDQMIAVAAGSTLMAYMLYTILSDTGQGRPALRLTIPFVVYGIFRFLFMIHRQGKGGDPAQELIEDWGLVVCGLLWAAACAAVMLWG